MKYKTRREIHGYFDFFFTQHRVAFLISLVFFSSTKTQLAPRILNIKTDVFSSSKIDWVNLGEDTHTLNMYIKTGLCILHALSYLKERILVICPWRNAVVTRNSLCNSGHTNLSQLGCQECHFPFIMQDCCNLSN